MPENRTVALLVLAAEVAVMTWAPISTVTPADAPFVAWIEPYGDPADDAASVEYDCSLDALGNVIDASNTQVANVTHWRKA